MSSLEGKIPPPVVAAVSALAVWGLSVVAPLMVLPNPFRLTVAAAILVLGVVFSVAGVLSFIRAKTTLNPTALGAASSLVRSGIFRITRNPMYVGLLLLIIALAVFLSTAWGLLSPLVFMVYIRRFQIEPEERALATLFGKEYADYKSGVRRWL